MVHLARAHVEGLRELGLRPRLPRVRHELQRDDDILGLQAEVHGNFTTIARHSQFANC